MADKSSVPDPDDQPKMENVFYEFEIRRKRMLYFYGGLVMVPILLGLYILYFFPSYNEQAGEYLHKTVNKDIVNNIEKIRNENNGKIASIEARLIKTEQILDSARIISEYPRNYLDRQNYLIKRLSEYETKLDSMRTLARVLLIDTLALSSLKRSLSDMKKKIDLYHGFSITDKKDIWDELSMLEKKINNVDKRWDEIEVYLEKYSQSYMSYEFPVNKSVIFPGKEWIVRFDSLQQRNSARVLIFCSNSDTDFPKDTIFGPMRIYLGCSYVFVDSLSISSEKRKYTLVPTYIHSRVLGRSIIGVNLSQ